MAKKRPRDDQKFVAHMEAAFEEAVRQVRLEERTMQRHFAYHAGARATIIALLETDCFKHGLIRQWVEDGGVSDLVINGVKIVPPEFP